MMCRQKKRPNHKVHAYALNISMACARKKYSRLPQSLKPCADLSMGYAHVIPDIMDDYPEESPHHPQLPALPIRHRGSAVPDKALIDRILTKAAIMDPPDIKKELGIAIETIKMVIQVAIEYERLTGFQDYAARRHDHNHKNVNVLKPKNRIQRDRKMTRRFWEALEKRNIALDDIKQMSDSWLATYLHNSKFLIFNSLESIRIFLQATACLGLDIHHYDVALPTDGWYDEFMADGDNAREMGFKNIYYTHIPLAHSPLERYHRIGIKISDARDVHIKSRYAFDRILFVLSCWLRLNELLQDETRTTSCY